MLFARNDRPDLEASRPKEKCDISDESGGNMSRRLPDKPRKEFRPVGPDQAVLNLLSQSSADLKRKRPTTFWLYFPTRKGAKGAGKKLAELGFSCECEKSAGSKKWLCLASRDVVPRIGEILSIRRTMDRIAAEFGGMYDGWETGMSDEDA